MTEQQAVTALIQSFLTAWNNRDGAAVAKHFTADVDYTDLPFGKRIRGAEGVGEFAESMSQTFSTDARFTLGQVITSGDTYAYEWTLAGKNDAGGVHGLPATGKDFKLIGVSVGRVRDGKIAENRDHWDLASYLTQVGLMSGGPPE